MRRSFLVLVLLLAALVAAASVRAEEPPPEPPEPPPPPVIAEAVTISGLDVAGLTKAEAREAVKAWFERPIRLRFRTRSLRAHPTADLRATALKWLAVDRALAAPSGTDIRLRVTVTSRGLQRYGARIEERFNREPRNSTLRLKNLRPRITKAKWGQRVKTWQLRVSLRKALRAHTRGPIRIRKEAVRPKVTPRSFGPTIVIRRGSKRLYLYRRTKFKASFGVATGLPQYPTPLGRFTIVTMQRHPWWYPPDSDWADGAQPIPPGPGNPLGTRWMGLSVGGVGIHGTPNSASIGYSASHGCIRMRIPDAEWLFERVRIGTTVFIVGA
jgi:lipoprotein-anchoring transpeptidase ErfK/SrfK